MTFTSYVNFIILLCLSSITFCYTFTPSNSLATDSSDDYETDEDSLSDEYQVSPVVSLARIFRKAYQFAPEQNALAPPETNDVISKRSRYYRKYPGKRQNRHYNNNFYDCNPSSTETVRLLYAIHQARLGDIEHIVFCNRLRNPKGIIPNPRYVGK